MHDAPTNDATYRAEKERRRKLGAAFEEETARAYERDGYTVERRGLAREKGKGDGGIDLLVWLPHQPSQRVAVQCKARRTGEVGQQEVQRMLGIIGSEQAVVRGVLVTTAGFTRAARNLASKQPLVELIDGGALMSRWGIDGNALHARFPRRDMVSPRTSVTADVDPPHFEVTRSNASGDVLTKRSSVRRGHRLIVLACFFVVVSAIGYSIAHWAPPDRATPDSAPIPTSVASPLLLPATARSVAAVVARPAPRQPSVARRAQDRKQHEERVPDVIAPQSAEPVVIYKAADMSDAEFEAWKRRKAQREQPRSPTTDSDSIHPDSTVIDGSVPAETMKMILRSNRRKNASTP